MYSQSNEEEVICDYFSGITNGSLIDIGAYDGITYSNSLALLERGWRGMLVEPSPGPFKRLMTRNKDNDRVMLVNAAVVPHACDPIRFHCTEDSISTAVEVCKERWNAAGNFRPIIIQPMKVDWLFKTMEFDFITLDVEGLNIEVFDAIPVEAMRRCKLICVEHETKTEQVTERCVEFGLTEQLLLNPENVIYARPR